MRKILIVSAMTSGLLFNFSAGAQERMDIVDFLLSWRDYKGAVVHIKSCVIAGVTTDFIRCETANGAGQIILETEGMEKESHRLALQNCPTGTGHFKRKCRVSVLGKVSPTRKSPTLTSVKFVR